MESWIIWLIVAAVLVVIEVLTQMVWTLCLAIGCVGGLIADLAGADLGVQLIVMAVTAVVAFIVLMPMFKRWHDSSNHHTKPCNRTGMDALLGRRGKVLEDVLPDSLGRVKIDGDNWQVKAMGIVTPLVVGTEVIVTGYDGNILIVESYNKIN
ncbi:MAG: NfeD family protein [Ruminococcus flavefaciens]|nr:NfeD family protein [Ruminococcus flavefaciens]